jgi:hypothetical protein
MKLNKSLILCAVFTFSFSGFAKDHQKLKESNRALFESVRELEETNIKAEETCLDEFLTSRKIFSQRSIAAPIYATIGIPASSMFGGSLGLLTALIVGAEGNILFGPATGAMAAYVSTGSMIGVGVTSAAFIGWESYNLTRLIQMNKMIKLIADARLNNTEAIEDLYKQIIKKDPEFKLSSQELSDEIAKLDETGKLCDGSLRKHPNEKVQRKVATKFRLKEFLIENF